MEILSCISYSVPWYIFTLSFLSYFTDENAVNLLLVLLRTFKISRNNDGHGVTLSRILRLIIKDGLSFCVVEPVLFNIHVLLKVLPTTSTYCVSVKSYKIHDKNVSSMIFSGLLLASISMARSFSVSQLSYTSPNIISVMHT